MSSGRIDPKWLDDPEIKKAEQRRHAQRGLVTQAVIWSPLFLAAFIGLLWFGYDVIVKDGDGGGTWFLVVVLSVGSFLFGSQSWQSIFDLMRGPKSMTGLVTRRWSRSDSFVIKSHYVRVDDRILRGNAYILDPILAGDRVKAEFYAHSGVLIEIERLETPPPVNDPSRLMIARESDTPS